MTTSLWLLAVHVSRTSGSAPLAWQNGPSLASVVLAIGVESRTAASRVRRIGKQPRDVLYGRNWLSRSCYPQYWPRSGRPAGERPFPSKYRVGRCAVSGDVLRSFVTAKGKGRTRFDPWSRPLPVMPPRKTSAVCDLRHRSQAACDAVTRRHPCCCKQVTRSVKPLGPTRVFCPTGRPQSVCQNGGSFYLWSARQTLCNAPWLNRTGVSEESYNCSDPARFRSPTTVRSAERERVGLHA